MIFNKAMTIINDILLILSIFRFNYIVRKISITGDYLKLLVCASEYYPHGSGIANVAFNVVEQLKKLGVECTICSPTGPDIKIKPIGKYGRLSLVHFWYKVNKHFTELENEYDVVWLHNPLFITKNPFKKCLVTIHTTPKGKVDKKIFPWYLHIYYLIASRIDSFCLNKINKENNVKFTAVDLTVTKELIQMGITDSKIDYIPNGVNIDLFKPYGNKKELKKKFNLPENSTIILSIGRINEQKQPLKLIELFSKISKNVDNLILVMGGTGELLEKAKKMVKAKNLNDVKLLGHVEYKTELPYLYACSDYYIMTSRYEGQPLTLLEAMSSGLKCIVTNLPNLKNIVNEAICGITIDINNEKKAMKDVIGYINENNQKHSINAREHAIKNFDWELIADKYLNEFQELKNI